MREAFVFGIPAGSAARTWPPWWLRRAPPPSSIAALTASLREVLSSYKVPRHLRIVEEKDLPKLPTGKVDLASLRGLFEEA